MGDETWASIQLVKSKRENFREKLKRRKAERDTILSVASGSGSSSPASPATSTYALTNLGSASITSVQTSFTGKAGTSALGVSGIHDTSVAAAKQLSSPGVKSAEVEKCLIEVLSESVPPITFQQLSCNQRLKTPLAQLPAAAANKLLSNLLQKFAYKELINVSDGGTSITSVHHSRLSAALEHHTKTLHGPGSPPASSGTYQQQQKSTIQCGSGDFSATTSTTTTTTTASAGAAAGGVKRPLGGVGDGGDESNKTAKTEHRSGTHAGLSGKKTNMGSPPSPVTDDVMSLLSAPSIRERENKRIGEEILELLNKPTAKEQSVAQHFRSQGGAKVREFCPRGTAEECIKYRSGVRGRDGRGWGDTRGGRDRADTGGREVGSCGKLHFRKIIQHHTDESLGDCSFLNTCFHMDTCRYVHYEVDYSGMEELNNHNATDNNSNSSQLQSTSQNNNNTSSNSIVYSSNNNAASNSNANTNNVEPNKVTPAGLLSPRRTQDRTVLFPPQWIQCDLRYLDMAILGKFSVIMADPPWDIHMELPYGTMSDDEMRQLNIPALQDEGLIFLWVTGRAMELGRDCLLLWGYERVDEIIWVKTNQLQRIIRTGRTGHWLNHGKEHCLVGMKGKPKINRCMDCDVIVAEVRATSHKPDEIYGIIERLSPGTRKIELFGRHHNVQPNWLTLGNQLEGVNLLEEDLIIKFREHHPDGVQGGKA